MEEKKIWAIKDGYLVHRDGSIYRLNWHNTGTMRKVKHGVNNCGYLQFCCNGKLTLVHRFIANCFIPNPQNLPEINHKDGNKLNNCVDNLEWCTHQYNCDVRSGPKKPRKVLQYTKDGEFVKEWKSAVEVHRILGFDQSHISKCCRGEEKSYKGCIWRYLV